jgi:2-oxoglutarate dehydrogenase complex dehydrogenase (E1) component-like enzyme
MRLFRVLSEFPIFLKRLYLLDSDASEQAIVCLDIKYGNKDSCEATLSIWRPQLFDTANGPELRAVEVVADKVGSILVTLTHF